MDIGFDRRKEYVIDKKLLKEVYDPKEILSIATFKERCIESGLWFLRGLYPMSDLKFQEESIMESYLDSAIRDTLFYKILKSIKVSQ